MQSPPNVSVSKNLGDPPMVVSLGNLQSNLASSLANTMGGGAGQGAPNLQTTMAMQQQQNNPGVNPGGQQQQQPGGMPGMNPAAMNSGLVMTSSAANSSQNNMSGMAGGNLIVANSLNKQPLNTVTMMGGPGNAGPPQNIHHGVAGMPNGPAMMNARVAAMQQQQQQQHLVGGPTRGQSPHQQVHQVGIVPGAGGPRMQAPNIGNMANMGQIGATSSPYGYGKKWKRNFPNIFKASIIVVFTNAFSLIIIRITKRRSRTCKYWE